MSTNTAIPPESAAPKLIWRFENFVLDERGPALTCEGRVLDCQDKPLQVLVYLLEHAGEVVTKDELIEHCWPRRIPSESVLTKAMAKLREVLGDEEQRLIKTAYGYGYRFSVPVQRAPADGVHSPDRGLKAGDTPPQRPQWVLKEKLGGTGESWLAKHAKTGDRRVFKFGLDDAALRVIKREITLFRVLDETPAAQGSYRRLLDWNLIEPPYFIEAEYIEGGSLRQWIEARGGCHAVPLDERLRLIAQIARALDAAHQAGVLHKDLKPANVLIEPQADGRGVALLADFGSGAMLDRKRLAELGVTQLGFTQTTNFSESIGGTPLYAAPEVIAGEMPTVLSDVYALGVMLFQILVGDWRRTLAPGWEREISDPLLREDVAAATDAAPAKRLPSAGKLAERLESLDVRRAERAREEALRVETELLRKREAREKARRPWMIAAAAVLVLGTAASSVMTWQALRAQADANREAARQRAVTQFLTELLTAADPMHEKSGDLDISVREVVDRAANEAGDSFKQQAEQEASVRLLLGSIYRNADEFDKARVQFESGLARARGLGKAGQPLVNELLMADLETHFAQYEYAPFKSALARLRAEPGLTTAQTLKADFKEASTAEPDDPDWSRKLSRLQALGPRMAAEFGSESGDYSAWLFELSQTQLYVGDLAASVATMRQILEIEQRAQPGHPSVLQRETNLGDALVRAGHPREGHALLEGALRKAEGKFAPESFMMMFTTQYLGHARSVLGDRAGAGPLLENSLAQMRRHIGNDSFLTHEAADDLASFYLAGGDARRALALQQSTYESSVRAYGPTNLYTRDRLLLLAQIRNAADPRGAADFIHPQHRQIRQLLGDAHWTTQALGAELGHALAQRGEREQARALLNAARDYFTARFPAEDPRRVRVLALAAAT